MRKHKGTIIGTVLLLMAAASGLLVSGCHKRPLWYPWELSARIRVDVDWSNCMEKPAGMTLLLYGDNGKTYKTVTSEVDGVEVDVMAGHYTALVFCYSVEEWASLRVSGLDAFDEANASITLSRSSWRVSTTKDGLDGVVTVHPSVISAIGDAEGFEVTDEMVDDWQIFLRRSGKQRWEKIDGGTTTVCTLVPEDLVYGLELRVRFDEVQNLKSIRAAVDGMASEVMLADGKTTDETCTQVFDDVWSMKSDWNDATLATVTGRGRTLGLPNDETKTIPDALRAPRANMLDMHILLRDLVTVIDTTIAVGDRWVIEPTYNRPNEPKTRLTLVLEIGIGKHGDDDNPIELPEVPPIEGGESGFDAVVGEWEEGGSVEVTIG